MTTQTINRRVWFGLSLIAFAASVLFIAPRLRSQPPQTSSIPQSLHESTKVSQAAKSSLQTAHRGGTTYLSLNPGYAVGRLRVMREGMTPSPKDILICRTVPDDLPRVAGIICTERKPPVDDGNLRAVHDSVPNAFVPNAVDDPSVKPHLNRWVTYRVTQTDFELRPSDGDSAEKHRQSMRPSIRQTPTRDLSLRHIRRLSDCGYSDRSQIGVKAANLAALHRINLPEGTIPDGFAVPFSFYDEFMRYNGLYDYARHLIGNSQFQLDRNTRASELKKMRTLIKKGKMPTPMLDALSNTQQSFADSTSIRCRSSTNTELLPRFGGAGLYESYTHHPEEGHLSKSIMQVYASLWNLRAFEEREFHRVDHFATAMAVILHPSYRSEHASGVAVTKDILYGSPNFHYVLTKSEDDLLVPPRRKLRPEEMLLPHDNNDSVKVIRSADNRSPYGESVLSLEHQQQLKRFLSLIHLRFTKLLQVSPESTSFAMEIEFKITQSGSLAIKQTRPWGVGNVLTVESN